MGLDQTYQFSFSFFYIFCSFRVVDWAGQPSAFYGMLNTHYRIVSYSFYQIRLSVCLSVTHGHWVQTNEELEHMYLRQRCSDAAVNKTILKPCLAVAVCRQYLYAGFSGRKIPRSSAYTISEKY